MWNWLTRVLGGVPRAERDGTTLASGPCWEVTAPADIAEFVRQLSGLLPPESVVYLEAGSPDATIEAFVKARACAPQLNLALGTIWPRPRVFHVPATNTNLTELASLFESHVTAEICVHFHAYCGQQVVLQWHDAFLDDSFLLALVVPEDRLRAFCERCACSYRLIDIGK